MVPHVNASVGSSRWSVLWESWDLLPCPGTLVTYDCKSVVGQLQVLHRGRSCPVVLRRSNTCDSTDAVCTGDISEVRKMGHEGVISHQIRRTCPQFCHVYSVSVIKVIDSGRNSQGLRSAQNSLYGFCPSESAASSLWWTLSSVGEAAGVAGWGPAHLHLPVQDFVASQWALALPCCHRAGCSTKRSKQKTSAWGKCYFFFNS